MLVEQPHEVVEAVLLLLSVRDLASISETCRLLYGLAHDNRLWRKRYALTWGTPDQGIVCSLCPDMMNTLRTDEVDWRKLFLAKRNLEKRWRSGKYVTRSFTHQGISVMQVGKGSVKKHGEVIAHYADSPQSSDSSGKKKRKDKPLAQQVNPDKLVWSWDLICGDKNGQVSVRGSYGFTETQSIQVQGSQIWWLEAQENLVVSSSSDATLKVTDLDKLEVLRTLDGHSHAIWGMDFNKQDDIVLSGDQRGLFIVHKLSTGEQIFSHQFQYGVLDCRYIPATRQCVAALIGLEIQVIDFSTNNVSTWPGHTGTIMCLRTHGPYLLSGSDDKTIRIWRVDTGECILSLDADGPVNDVRVVDDKLIAAVTCSSGSYLRIWNFSSGEFWYDVAVPLTNRVYCLAPLHDRIYAVLQSSIEEIDFSHAADEIDLVPADKHARCNLQ